MADEGPLDALPIVQEATRIVRSLAEAAFTDRLTRLLNRGALETIAHQHDANTSAKIGTVFIDLTGFKELNDRLGHAAGDVGLERVARELGSIASKHTAQVFRHGGDEFVLLVADQQLDELVRAVETAFANGIEFAFEENPAVLRAAIGYAHAAADAVMSQMLDRAETASRSAKIGEYGRAVEWSALLTKEEHSSLRRRCRTCAATTSMQFAIAQRRPDCLGVCPNCGADYPAV